MALKIRWSPEADTTFSAIINYLKSEWSEKEIRNFVRKTLKLLGQITENPKMFKASGVEEIRKAVIGRHNSLFYLIDEKEGNIILLSFWDNRQNPANLKY
jgi:plasmid stabilization system protein ParE